MKAFPLRLAVSLAWALAWIGSAAFAAVQQPPLALPPLAASGPAPVDPFHPDRDQPAEPALGGAVNLRLESLPASLNNALENMAVTGRMLLELHETLLQQDFESLEWRAVLAESWTTEDMLVLKPEACARWPLATPLEPVGGFESVGGTPPAEGPGRVLYGRIVQTPKGWSIEPQSTGNPLRALLAPGASALEVPDAEAAAIERGTVFTFALRPGVRWHDGHPFDAHDVRFSLELYHNPFVPCGEKRFSYLRLPRVEELGALGVRCFYQQQHFNAIEAAGRVFLLPAHLYDLLDPEHPNFDAKASLEARAKAIVDNPHNRDFVGLGPYRLTRFDSSGLEAQRFEGYFDPAHGGYLDTLRWRYVRDDAAAFQALLNGELDFFDRLSTADFFGPATAGEDFQKRFVKGYLYNGTYGYVGWNTHLALFQDQRVRQALAGCVDLAAWKHSYYQDLALQVTGHQNCMSPGYDRELQPVAFDPAAALDLFAQAGWFDRDGDGLLDKDGNTFRFELLYVTGSDSSLRFAQKFQEDLKAVGIAVQLTALDYSSLKERVNRRSFQACLLAWVLPIESDPEQVFHSRWGGPEVLNSSNNSGLQDREVDALIAQGQRELEPAARAAVWRELQQRLYFLQPYLFHFNAPRKFALSRGLRGFQALPVDPNYALRRWYWPAGTPGTRPLKQ